MNNQLKLSVILSCSLGLIACGGGGGGSSSSSGGSGSTKAPVELKDLKIDNDNALESVYHVDIDVSLPGLDSKQAYISICDNSNGVDNINYDQCLIKAALKDGAGQYELRVANHCDSLVAVVSVMEPGTPAMIYTLEHDNQAHTDWLIQ
ncbi:hypothetical protein [Vibrio atypicus]|uniref:hypothetical protein n=1 Tax=Vibrio atypicus TaxID=558271 RepID=UPI00135AA6CA|nr:hypothetical protein [Vibrio atypicus]